MIHLDHRRGRNLQLRNLRQVALAGLHHIMRTAAPAAAHHLGHGRGDRNIRLDVRGFRRDRLHFHFVPGFQRKQQNQSNHRRVRHKRHNARLRIPLHRQRIFHRDRLRRQHQRGQLLREKRVLQVLPQVFPERLLRNSVLHRNRLRGQLQRRQFFA